MILDQLKTNGGGTLNSFGVYPPIIFIYGAESVVINNILLQFQSIPLSLIVADSRMEDLDACKLMSNINQKIRCVEGEYNTAYQIEYMFRTLLKDSGSIDCAINNFKLPEIGSTIIDATPSYSTKALGDTLNKVFLFVKYEIALFLGRETGGTIINIFHGGPSGLVRHAHATYALLQGVKGLTTSVNQSYNELNIRVASFLLPNSKDIANLSESPQTLTNFELGEAEDINSISEITAYVYNAIQKDHNSFQGLS